MIASGPFNIGDLVITKAEVNYVQNPKIGIVLKVFFDPEYLETLCYVQWDETGNSIFGQDRWYPGPSLIIIQKNT